MYHHLIMSRKEQSNKKKLSPLTNHKNTKNGTIKGSFDRVNLFKQAAAEEEEEEEKEDLLMINYRRRITNNEIQTMNYKLSVWKRKLYLSQAPLPV